METSHIQTLLFTEDELTSSQGAFHAKTQATLTSRQAEAVELMAKELDLSPTCYEQLTKSDRVTWWPRTWQTFLRLTEDETSERFSPNWPEWGIMQNGEFIERAKKVPLTNAHGASWLFTPTASDYKRVKLSYPMYKKRLNRTPGTLPELMFRYFGAVPGKLNLQFYSWMMGYPVDYIRKVLKPTGTP